jgi:hypothetical protein
MRRMARRQPREFEIFDVTSEVIRDNDVPYPSPLSDSDEEALLSSTQTYGKIQRKEALTQLNAVSSGSGNKIAQEAAESSAATTTSDLLHDASPTSLRQTESAVANLLFLSQSAQPGIAAGQHLQNSLGPVPVDIFSRYMDHMQAFTPDVPFEDGVFLPGSAYHELHSTLRNRLFQEVRSNGTTRDCTPEDIQGEKENNHIAVGLEEVTVNQTRLGIERTSTDADLPWLKKEEEILLWRNWFDEIAPWLDKFDGERHFQHIIPTIAARHDHLRYAMLALSARQLELKETTLPTDRSLALYQEAIHLLLPRLPSRSTEVIASCLILCVLEMVSCSPKGWRRHLDGCASLMEAVGINGLVGGVEQALFWCFARMDVCGGLISSAKTLIPVSHWASKVDLEADVKLYRLQNNFEMWANYAVYLVAQVLDLLAGLSGSHFSGAEKANAKFRVRWLHLWKHVSDWHALRPAPLHSITTMPSCDSSPFPTVLFSNPAAISGNQLYHTASILMLQNQPPGVRLSPKPRSILWHARQVCGISISNDHHGAWTNGLQPLWIAGRCMSHPAEHQAILDILEKIERESGWGTRWRADDLKEFWGDLGE